MRQFIEPTSDNCTLAFMPLTPSNREISLTYTYSARYLLTLPLIYWPTCFSLTSYSFTSSPSKSFAYSLTYSLIQSAKFEMEIHVHKIQIHLKGNQGKYAGDHAFLEIVCGPHTLEVAEQKEKIEENMEWKDVNMKFSVTDVVLDHGELAIKVMDKERELLLCTAHYNLGAIFGTSSLSSGDRTELVSNLMGRGILREKAIGDAVLELTVTQTHDYLKEAAEAEAKRMKDEEYLSATEKERETRSLRDVFELFGRALNERIEHLEILKMYRIIEKAHVSL